MCGNTTFAKAALYPGPLHHHLLEITFKLSIWAHHTLGGDHGCWVLDGTPGPVMYAMARASLQFQTLILMFDTSHEPEGLCWCRGQASYGELAYGENGKKSSANPEECPSLKGVFVQQATPRSTWLLT